MILGIEEGRIVLGNLYTLSGDERDGKEFLSASFGIYTKKGIIPITTYPGTICYTKKYMPIRSFYRTFTYDGMILPIYYERVPINIEGTPLTYFPKLPQSVLTEIPRWMTLTSDSMMYHKKGAEIFEVTHI